MGLALTATLGLGRGLGRAEERLYGSQAEAQEFIASCDCPTYLAHAEKRLGEEAERVANYLDVGSEPRVVKVGGKGWVGCWKHGHATLLQRSVISLSQLSFFDAQELRSRTLLIVMWL